MIQLRNYQQEAVESVINNFQDGTSKQLIVLPTAAGKTVIFSSLIAQLKQKTLILVHRDELITQTVHKLSLFMDSKDIGICKAKKNQLNKQVVVASVQTACQKSRLEQLKQHDFQILIVDECHHAVAKSYKNIMSALGFLDTPTKLLLGVTATPTRADKISLGTIFKKVVYFKDISSLIDEGFLSPVLGRKILTNFSIKGVKTRGGDFEASSLAAKINIPERNAFIVEKWLQHANGMKTIAFCANVKHAIDLASTFNDRKIRTAAIYGAMPSKERAKILKQLATGNIDVVTSVNVLTEGFDCPELQCAIMARATKSSALYTQCVGRVLRKHPSKDYALVLDFSDKHNRLDECVYLNTILPEANYVQEQEQIKKHTDVSLSASVEFEKQAEIDEPFDILNKPRFIWVDIGDGEWSLTDDHGLEMVLRPEGQGYCADLYTNNNKIPFITTNIPLEYAQGTAEDYARKHFSMNFGQYNSSWMQNNKAATQSQLNYLNRKGKVKGKVIGSISKAQAAILIRQIIALERKRKRQLHNEPITTAQKLFLKKHGIDTTGLSKQSAMNQISILKKQIERHHE